jgi:hypothetical protein
MFVCYTGPGSSAGATRIERITSHNRENTGIVYSCEHLFEINKKIVCSFTKGKYLENRRPLNNICML